MSLLWRWLTNAVALLVVAYLLEGVRVADVPAALVAAALLGIVNALIRPVALLLSLPLNILTLGLFTWVINALMVMLTASLVNGFEVDGFLNALLAAFILGIVSSLTSAGRRRRR